MAINWKFLYQKIKALLIATLRRDGQKVREDGLPKSKNMGHADDTLILHKDLLKKNVFINKSGIEEDPIKRRKVSLKIKEEKTSD